MRSVMCDVGCVRSVMWEVMRSVMCDVRCVRSVMWGVNVQEYADGPYVTLLVIRLALAQLWRQVVGGAHDGGRKLQAVAFNTKKGW